MASTGITIDRKKAGKILKTKWGKIKLNSSKSRDFGEVQTDLVKNKKTNDSYLDEGNQEIIRELLRCDTKWIRYFLVTAVLAKATNDKAHYRSIVKDNQEVGDRGHQPRGLAKDVVAPWNADIGYRIGPGVTNEPLSGNPVAGGDRDLLEREQKSDDPELREKLVDILNELQEETDNGDTDEEDVLMAVLNEVYELERREYEFSIPEKYINYDNIKEGISDFLGENPNSERMESVATGIIDVCYQSKHIVNDVEKSSVHAADRPKGAAGDIGIRVEDELVFSAEIKPGGLTKSEITAGLTKAKDKSVHQYLFVVNEISEDSHEDILSTSEVDASIITIHEMLTWLQPLSSDRRQTILENITEYLEEVGSNNEVMSDWEKYLDEINNR